jgi:hypothetical protein
MDAVEMLLLTADVKYIMADYNGNKYTRIKPAIIYQYSNKTWILKEIARTFGKNAGAALSLDKKLAGSGTGQELNHC